MTTKKPFPHQCEVCGSPVKIEGNTTKYYVAQAPPEETEKAFMDSLIHGTGVVMIKHIPFDETLKGEPLKSDEERAREIIKESRMRADSEGYCISLINQALQDVRSEEREKLTEELKAWHNVADYYEPGCESEILADQLWATAWELRKRNGGKNDSR